MSIIGKLNTLFRAGLRESAERVTDANAILIYRQEIADAENLLQRRRTALASLIATRKDLESEMDSLQRRLCEREQQIAAIAPAQRSEKLLTLAARDISVSERHLAGLEKRRESLVQRINSEELTLRKLVAEIREHRRESRILSAYRISAGSLTAGNGSNSAEARLAALRETRNTISGSISNADVSEASFAEAVERVDGDPLDRELADQGRDPGSVQMAAVLKRLREAPGPEA